MCICYLDAAQRDYLNKLLRLLHVSGVQAAGPAVREVWLQSGLPKAALMAIWNLADIDKDNLLDNQVNIALLLRSHHPVCADCLFQVVPSLCSSRPSHPHVIIFYAIRLIQEFAVGMFLLESVQSGALNALPQRLPHSLIPPNKRPLLSY